MQPSEEIVRSSKRPRASLVPTNTMQNAVAQPDVDAGVPARPTSAEETSAKLKLSKMLRADEDGADPRYIKEKANPPQINVLACAIALEKGEAFPSEKAAKRAFRVGPSTDLRESGARSCAG